MTLHVLDLFSGIGGFSLGLERTGGFKTVAFCEIEKYPQQILKQHWPEVPIYEDVKTLTAEQLRADGITVDVICGGFPCQDISLAGKGAGLEGERSGLWWEFHRLIKEIRPQWVIAENVSALRSRGLDTVLRSLAEIGYDAEWHCIPASAIGAPHRRDRIWIVAHPTSGRREARDLCDAGSNGQSFSERRSAFFAEPSKTSAFMAYSQHTNDVADPDGSGWNAQPLPITERSQSKNNLDVNQSGESSRTEHSSAFVADTDSAWKQQQIGSQPEERGWPSNGGSNVADPMREGLEGQFQRSGQTERPIREAGKPILGADSWSQRAISWATEPNVGRVAHGVPKRVDRLKALGNAVVPQIPQLIGEAILASSH